MAMTAKILITTSEYGDEPQRAEWWLRKSRNTQDHLTDAFTQANNQELYVPDNSILLMMGITDDLIAECQRAEENGYHWISAEQRTTLRRWYARVKLGTFKDTVTLVAMAAKSYWDAVGRIPANIVDYGYQREGDWARLPGRTDVHYCTLSNHGDPAPGRAWDNEVQLPLMLRACKGQGAWVRAG
jgi:hypothetical protein